MLNQDDFLKITDLPTKVLEEVTQVIHSYSTGLVKISVDQNDNEIANLIGSGTFIVAGNVAGILTADHVVNMLGDSVSLGLTLREQEHKYEVKAIYLDIRRIARGVDESEGPDLAFIALPSSKLGAIRATKSFYNIERNRDRMLTAPPEFDLGIWALFGVPDIHTTNEPSKRGFGALKGFHGLCGFGFVRGSYSVGNYDFLDFKVKYDSSPSIPNTFGGVSGGGVWQIPLLRTPNGKIEPKEYILSGVAFYQSKRSGLFRDIKCHARQSIYDLAYKAVCKMSS